MDEAYRSQPGRCNHRRWNQGFPNRVQWAMIEVGVQKQLRNMTMRIRKPAVSGRFYPADPPTLRRTIEKHLAAAPIHARPEAVAAVIAPHAGYPYSGLTAAHAYKRLLGKKVRRVVLLGCSHHYQFDGASIFRDGGYETPLGIVPIDESLARHLVTCFGNTCPEAHENEHALEVHIPFLQMALEGDFKLVPILFGSRPGDHHEEMGAELARCLEPDDLVLASTDLSHFLSESEANALDQRSLDQVLRKDAHKLCEAAARGRCSLCGASAVVSAMAYANAIKATHWEVLDYRTSAWASGETDRVVGYSAISMERDVA